MAEYTMTVSEEACYLREVTGTSAVAETVRTVAAALARYDIPHRVAGGLAVLILLRKLPRSLAIETAVQDLCLETWDSIQAEQ